MVRYRFLVTLAILTSLVVIMFLMKRTSHELFDRSYYRRIHRGMTLKEIEAALGYGPGEYDSVGEKIIRENWVPGWGHGPPIGNDVEETSWMDPEDDKRFLRHKSWIGPEWAIDVVFDHSGGAICKSLIKMKRDEAESSDETPQR